MVRQLRLKDGDFPFPCVSCGRLIRRLSTKSHKRGLCTKKCSGDPKCGKWTIKNPKSTEELQKEVIKKRKEKKTLRKIGKSNFYETKEWQALRYATIRRYERKCMVCFRSNLELHVDHIKPISKFPELALNAENLQILCRDCNLGKSNTDSIDWRPNDGR